MPQLSLMERLFPDRLQDLSAEAAFSYMSLNCLVFMDLSQYKDQLKEIFGATGIAHVDGDTITPSVLALRRGNLLLLAFEGTKGRPGWLELIANAGVEYYGPAPGQCFSPFATAARRLEPIIAQAWREGDFVTLTGHSLGATQAAMLTGTFWRSGWNLYPAWCFACPRLGDASYWGNYKARCLTLNLAGDPVPYLPPDVVGYLNRDRYVMRYTQLLDRPPGQQYLGPPPSAGGPIGDLDYLVTMAASALDWRHSPHNTYQYLRQAWGAMSGPYPTDILALRGLVQALGLFDPWPPAAPRRPAGSPLRWQSSRDDWPISSPPAAVPPFSSQLVPFTLEG